MKQEFNKSSLLFQNLIENSSWGIILFDSELKALYSIPSSEQIDGWKFDERKKNNFSSIIHPNDLESALELINKIIQTDKATATNTFRFKHANGTYIYLHCNFTNLLKDENVGAIVFNFIDVSIHKMTELELDNQTNQITVLLETMNDGFISLDENLVYIYANGKALQMANKSKEDLIGKNIWEVFPEVVGSSTYQAIQTALEQKLFVCNQDFYAPMQLWQENRAYPFTGGVYLFIRDITKQKKEEQHLRLLESVITNTTDSIIITEAEPFDLPGPRIIYVNKAFTSMTGYSAEEVIGKTPRILQGAKTDQFELARLSKCLHNWEVCEATLVNYKKNGDEFWINFVINPVSDEKGWFTHWISIERDVTQRKNEEIQNVLLAETNQLFNERMKLAVLLKKLTEKVVAYDHFEIVEIWLVGEGRRKINLGAKTAFSEKGKQYFKEVGHKKNLAKGECLPGLAWEKESIIIWHTDEEQIEFFERDAAKNSGIVKIYGIPLYAESDVIGVLIIGLTQEKPGVSEILKPLFEKISADFGVEIKRKQLEQELHEIFNLAPDIICIIGVDGYLKKVNPAMLTLLGFSESELLNSPINSFVDPITMDNSKMRLAHLLKGEGPTSFENRFITKEGKIISLSWAVHLDKAQGQLYCVAKDVTEKIESDAILKELQTNLQAIFQSSSEGFILIDLDGIIKTFNPVAKEMINLNTNKVINLGDSIYNLISFSEQEVYNNAIVKVLKGEQLNFDHHYHRSNGDKKWFTHTLNPVFWMGEVKGISINSKDITERKLAQNLLQASKANLISVIENTDAFIYSLDRDLKYITYNNKLAQIIFDLYHVTISPGYPVLDFILENSPTEILEWKSRYEKALSGEVVKFEKEIINNDFHSFSSFSIYPIFEDDQITGISCFVHDITKRKLAENETLTYLKAIEAQNEKLKEISWLQSHVIRTPLARIMGIIPLLKDSDNLANDNDELLTHLLSSAHELDKVIREITEKTKPN